MCLKPPAKARKTGGSQGGAPKNDRVQERRVSALRSLAVGMVLRKFWWWFLLASRSKRPFRVMFKEMFLSNICFLPSSLGQILGIQRVGD